MPIALNGSTSGKVTVQAPAVAGTNTLTLPATTGNIISSADTGTVTQTMLASNVAGNGPAFRAYSGTNQTGIASSTSTKVRLDNKSFDTNNCFDATTNYRFTPTVAGYYQINGGVLAGGTVNTQLLVAFLYKNGATVTQGNYIYYAAGYSTAIATVSDVIYCNGTTDYIELYIYGTVSGTLSTTSGATAVYMSGFLARSA